MANDILVDENHEPDEDTLNPEEIVESLAPPEPTPEPEEVEDVPEKYRGKSIQDVIGMHQAAEKQMGKQSGEVGELRAVVDDYIKSQTVTSEQAQPDPAPEETDVDFFEDPQLAVSRAIDSHPSVVAAKKATEGLHRQSAAQAVNELHPDAGEIVSDPGFAKFVQESPIRKELYARADAHSDVDAANELLTAYKARVGVAKDAATADRASRSDQLKQANTGTAKGSAATQGKRIYKRQDIIRLMRDKPEVYEKHAQDIQQAYAEGRVK